MKKYYVYQLRRSDLDNPFYIGKGHGKRAWNHLTGKEGPNKHKNNTIKKAIGEGVEVVVEMLLADAEESEALRFELWAIKLWGRADLNEGPLTNMTDGGDGVSGLKPSAKRLQILSQQIGDRNPNYGNRWSQEQKDHLSKLKKGKLRTAESIKKQSDSVSGSKHPRYGKPVSEESRAKSRATQLGKIRPKLQCPHCDRKLDAGNLKKHILAHQNITVN